MEIKTFIFSTEQGVEETIDYTINQYLRKRIGVKDIKIHTIDRQIIYTIIFDYRRS